MRWAMNEPTDPLMTDQPGMMRVARRELHRWGGRPLYPILLVVLPLLSFVLLWITFSSGTVHDLPVAVINLDGSPMSRKLVRMIDATATMVVTRHVGNERAAEELILSGEVYAAILIPNHLESDELRGEPAVVTLYRNAQFMLPAGVSRRDAITVLSTYSAGIE